MSSIVKRGPNQFHVRIRQRGYPLCCRTFTTRDEAKRWAATVESEMLRGVYVSSKEAESTTLDSALDRYGKEVTPLKKGAANELRRIKYWKRQPLASRFLGAVRGVDLATYRDQRLAQGISGNTIRLELALISHLYTVARKDWGMEALINPATNIRKPKLAKGRERRLLAGELTKLIAYCDQTGKTRLKATIHMAVATGMRRGELAKLRWTDIDLDSRVLQLLDTKNGENRRVPLSSVAMAALSSLGRNADGRVFGVHADVLTWEFACACKALAIQGLRLHDLRHEATSRFFELGFGLMEVSSITGHKSLQMLKRYTHLRAEDLVARLG
jgi:integrase